MGKVPVLPVASNASSRDRMLKSEKYLEKDVEALMLRNSNGS